MIESALAAVISAITPVDASRRVRPIRPARSSAVRRSGRLRGTVSASGTIRTTVSAGTMKRRALNALAPEPTMKRPGSVAYRPAALSTASVGHNGDSPSICAVPTGRCTRSSCRRTRLSQVIVGKPYAPGADRYLTHGKKISSRESEDLQELSAGSDDSEELPDPTRGTHGELETPSRSGSA